jgi:ABC-type Fe3+-hydroxamate transport system substrate-binding protein
LGAEAIALVVGSTIGSGIVRSPAGIADRLPGPLPLVLFWAAGGVLALAGALTLAEIACAVPRTGGLYSPSLESVVALAPDLVVLVPSLEQREFRARLSSLSLSVREFDPVRFEQVLDTIRELGRLVGHEAEAKARVDAIRRAQRAVQRAVAGRPPLSAVLVLQREPLFVAGRGSFLDEMLAMAGARNLGAELGETWPRTSVEWLVGAAPEVILDSDSDPAPAARYWARWPSLPAVAHGRVVAVDAGDVTLPGPDLDRALVKLARALHGDALALDIEVAP